MCMQSHEGRRINLTYIRSNRVVAKKFVADLKVQLYLIILTTFGFHVTNLYKVVSKQIIMDTGSYGYP